MSDDKPKPVDDLKEGLGLLFRAAKGAVEKLPTGKLEDVAKDAAKEVSRAFESLGNEIEKVVGMVSGSPPAHQPPQPPSAADRPKDEANPQEPPKEQKFDDGYAHEPPKGPRVG